MSNKSTIARPYAKAAFAIALEQKNVRAWEILLHTLAWILQQPQVIRFLQDPRLTPQKRYMWLVEMCSSIIHEQERNFLELLANNGRLSLLPEIAELFETYRVEQEKIVSVQVTSAFPLSVSEQRELIEVLKIRLKKDVVVEYTLDNVLIGGAIIRANDLVIDGSVRGKLARLNVALVD